MKSGNDKDILLDNSQLFNYTVWVRDGLSDDGKHNVFFIKIEETKEQFTFFDRDGEEIVSFLKRLSHALSWLPGIASYDLVYDDYKMFVETAKSLID